jgi:YVTN family beta-propeller protein
MIRRLGGGVGTWLGLSLGTVAAAAQGPRLYVANQDDATVSVVDIASGKVVETIDLAAMGFGPNAKPHHAQVESDGGFWYLSMIGAGKVVKFDRTNRIVGSVSLEVPGLLALDPTADRLVVGRSMSAVNPPMRIAVIRRSDMTLLEEHEVFFPRPHALVVDPRGQYAYVASLGVNQFASVRLEDGQSTLVDFEGGPQTFTQFAVSRDGHWLVATAQSANQLLVYDVREAGKPVLFKTVPMAKGPFEPVFTHDGKTVFVTNLDANLVTAVDVATWLVTGTIESVGFGQPHGVALSADGRFLFVGNRHQAGGAHDHEGQKAVSKGTLVVICIPTRTAEAVLEVGNYAAGLGVAQPTRAPATPTTCR